MLYRLIRLHADSIWNRFGEFGSSLNVLVLHRSCVRQLVS